jgi:hypothetical protein
LNPVIEFDGGRGPASQQRMLVGTAWRRERNWDPTLSEFVTSNSLQGEMLMSNSFIESTRE